MNKKQRKTYDAIFVDPIRRNIVWDDVVNLIQSLGGIILKAMAQEFGSTLTKFPLIFIRLTSKRTKKIPN
jgi:hypothetical protein